MREQMVAIIGRPNVGKSTLFNRIVGKKIAIVEDTPGVTRDRIIADTDWGRYRFALVDTGGIEPTADSGFLSYMREQAQTAIEMADVILMMVDGMAGVTADDHMVAELLRRSKKPVIICVNKIDNPQRMDLIYDFYELGMETVVGISASLGLGINDLLDETVKYLKEPATLEEEEDSSISIAVIGKPNAGKSSLVNRLLGEDRLIVSDVPGTTRDAIDSELVRNGKKYTLIDTAGMRRKRSIEENSIERFGVLRSIAAIRRSDVVLMMIDGAQGLTEQDAKIVGLAHEDGKAIMIVINKWDIVEKDTHTMDKYTKDVYRELSFLTYAPVVYLSAKTGLRVEKLFETIDLVYEESKKRIQTGLVNEVLSEAVSMVEPPTDKGRRLRILFGTQASVQPPTFVLFVNDPLLMHFSYQRYLENYFRKTFGFTGTPIRFIIRKREERN